jgi:two-component system, OmpR family, phosphate regulon sensor histidine kinase PhoR
MSAQSPAYSKKHVLEFMAAFYTCAILSLVTIIANASAVPLVVAGKPQLLSVFIGFAVILPAALLIDTYVRRIRIVFYGLIHLFGALGILFYLGTYNPMLAVWLIICIVTYLELGFRSFIVGSVFLYVVCLLFCFTIQSYLPHDFPIALYTFYSLSFTTALVLTGYVMIRIIDGANRRRQELEHARKSETEQLDKVNTLLNSISEAILTLDADMRVTSQNAAALAFFDTNESLVGKKIDEILLIADEKSEKINVQKLVAGVTKNTFRDDVVLPNSEQGNMRISLQLSPIYTDNQRQGIVMVIRDITKQKTLEDEKDEFISVTSHELRTPIAIAEGSLSNLVIMQEKGLDPAKLKSAASVAHDQVIYLAGVVNDLSTLSRAERGVADTPEPVDVNQLMHDLYAKYEPDATKKSLRLDLDVPAKLPIVQVSRLYLEELLQNFITNAIKYTQSGTVTLAAKVVDGGVRCSVSDSGIGISKTDQKHIFEKFYRSEDYRTRETSGTGLGLYVVQKLAAKVGTRIEVESRLNHGSTFSLTVPLESKIQSTGKRSSVDEK